MKIFFRRFGLAVLVVLFAGMGFCTYNFATAERRVRALCAQIQPGMSLANLQTFSSKHGLSRPPREGVGYIVETKTNGRWGCKIVVENSVVKKSEYTFAD